MNLVFDKNLLARVAEQYQLNFVILHGSYASGRSRPDSDVDIAVVRKQALSFDEFVSLYTALADIFGDTAKRELDLKPLYGADPFLRHEVVQDGQLLYGDPTAYEEYKAATRRMFFDARQLFALERTLIKKYQRHLNKLIAAYA